MAAYYNEIDPYAAQWLRNLIAAGHIAAGDVDERSIVDVRLDDLRSYRQCHFFAGIGGWSYALRLAGWDDERPVWTGSCPCQPLSVAGQRQGHADQRHLWPAFYRLIAECRPATVFGEQVASKDGREWLAAVRADLEASGYAVGAADLCAASVGAPHIRQRLWWVAQSDGDGGQHSAFTGAMGTTEPRSKGSQSETGKSGETIGDGCSTGELADAERDGRRADEQERETQGREADRRIGSDSELADADGRHASTEGLQRGGEHRQQPEDGGAGELADTADSGYRLQRNGSGGQREPIGDSVVGNADNSGLQGRSINAGEHASECTARTASPWDDLVWLPCTDGKARPTQSGLQPLVNGAAARVGRLRAYGNAIIPQVAAEFIKAADV